MISWWGYESKQLLRIWKVNSDRLVKYKNEETQEGIGMQEAI